MSIHKINNNKLPNSTGNKFKKMTVVYRILEPQNEDAYIVPVKQLSAIKSTLKVNNGGNQLWFGFGFLLLGAAISMLIDLLRNTPDNAGNAVISSLVILALSISGLFLVFIGFTKNKELEVANKNGLREIEAIESRYIDGSG